MTDGVSSVKKRKAETEPLYLIPSLSHEISSVSSVIVCWEPSELRQAENTTPS